MDKMKFLRDLGEGKIEDIACMLGLRRVAKTSTSGMSANVGKDSVSVYSWAYEEGVAPKADELIEFNDHEVLRKSGCMPEQLSGFNESFFETMKKLCGESYVVAHADYLSEMASNAETEASELLKIANNLRRQAQILYAEAEEMAKQ